MKNSKVSKEDRMLFDAINTKVGHLQHNSKYGVAVAKKKIPQTYITAYDVSNLFRIELPLFWRMLYTITDDGVEIISFVVDIIDHKSYNKKFGYRKN